MHGELEDDAVRGQHHLHVLLQLCLRQPEVLGRVPLPEVEDRDVLHASELADELPVLDGLVVVIVAEYEEYFH